MNNDTCISNKLKKKKRRGCNILNMKKQGHADYNY